MAFEDDEQSKHAGRPVELFKYEGTYDDYFYTSGPEEVTYLGDLYVPIATKRSTINVATQNDDNSEVTIELPVSSQLIAVYGFQIAPPDLTLTIYRGHNGDYIRAWSGNVENIQVVKGTATVRVPSDLAAALNADFPNVYYQGPCNHALFDDRCGILYGDWSFATEVAAVDATVVTLDGIGTLDGELVGGDAVLASGERRMIVSQAGNVITVNYPFAQIAINDVITIAAGCDLAWAGDCATRFDNQERNGGFPFIPPKNIFEKGLEPGKDVADVACNPYIPEFEGWYYKFVLDNSGVNCANCVGWADHGGPLVRMAVSAILNPLPGETGTPVPADELFLHTSGTGNINYGVGGGEWTPFTYVITDCDHVEVFCYFNPSGMDWSQFGFRWNGLDWFYNAPDDADYNMVGKYWYEPNYRSHGSIAGNPSTIATEYIDSVSVPAES